MKRLVLTSICAAAFGAVCSMPANASISINFDALNDGSLVNDYYNGGLASDGTGPGPNYGVTFANAYVLNEFTENEGLLVTPPNSITFLSGVGAIMDVAAGFDTGFSFNYSAPFFTGEVDVFSGLDGTGTLLATITLPLTTNGAGMDGCMGHNYCPVFPIGVTFAGIAMSVNFSGTANYVVYDDITLGSATPGTPEASTWAMLLLGFGGLGFASYRASRRTTAITA